MGREPHNAMYTSEESPALDEMAKHYSLGTRERNAHTAPHRIAQHRISNWIFIDFSIFAFPLHPPPKFPIGLDERSTFFLTLASRISPSLLLHQIGCCCNAWLLSTTVNFVHRVQIILLVEYSNHERSLWCDDIRRQLHRRPPVLCLCVFSFTFRFCFDC